MHFNSRLDIKFGQSQWSMNCRSSAHCHSKWFLSVSRVIAMHILREMKVKGTGSRCLLEECVKDNYYARFHPHSYHCYKEMKFIPRLDINFLDSTQIVDRRTDERTES